MSNPDAPLCLDSRSMEVCGDCLIFHISQKSKFSLKTKNAIVAKDIFEEFGGTETPTYLKSGWLWFEFDGQDKRFKVTHQLIRVPDL